MKRLVASIVTGIALFASALMLLPASPETPKPNAPVTSPWGVEGFILPWQHDFDKHGSSPRYYPDQSQYHLPPAGYVAPQENRGEEYWKYLKVSVRIRNGNVSGSGTICYYDRNTKTAYIISCGHLFRGGEKTAVINCFYKNSEKLKSPANYTAKVLAFSKGEDISFLSFQPDWDIDQYYPIARVDYPLVKGQTYYSCGCDGAREVACYLMEMVGLEGRNLVLVKNGPRHGRSGGGLLTEDGYYVGICWGSTDPYNGTGRGLFVPLHRIHDYAKTVNLGWLLEVPKDNLSPARMLPIIDMNGPQKNYPRDYIPLP